jgi:hypothetical protein
LQKGDFARKSVVRRFSKKIYTVSVLKQDSVGKRGKAGGGVARRASEGMDPSGEEIVVFLEIFISLCLLLNCDNSMA